MRGAVCESLGFFKRLVPSLAIVLSVLFVIPASYALSRTGPRSLSSIELMRLSGAYWPPGPHYACQVNPNCDYANLCAYKTDQYTCTLGQENVPQNPPSEVDCSKYNFGNNCSDSGDKVECNKFWKCVWNGTKGKCEPTGSGTTWFSVPTSCTSN